MSARTPLAAWMQRNCIRPSALARKLQISHQQLGHYMAGRRSPRGPVLLRLVKETKLSFSAFIVEVQKER